MENVIFLEEKMKKVIMLQPFESYKEAHEYTLKNKEADRLLEKHVAITVEDMKDDIKDWI